MLSRIYAVAAVVLPVAVLACSSASSGSGSLAPRPSPNLITRAELQQAGVRNAYEAVQRLRPNWLLIRSGQRSFSMETQVAVFQDQVYLGNEDTLRDLGIDGIYEIRYLDGSTAKNTLPGLGDMHVQGAIIVHMTPP
jgi:hypothetical protein